MQKPSTPPIDLTATTQVFGPDGGQLFGQAFIMRKISKFLAGTDEDSYIPIPVFYDLTTNKIIKDSLPPEIRDEYSDISL